jgi:uncharacterized coiled-coil protein SlyX
MQNTVRRQLDSTAKEEPLVTFDPTVTRSSGLVETTAGSQLRPTHRSSAGAQISYREIIGAIVAAAIVGFLGWAGITLVSLNREVGEMKSRTDHMDRLEQKLDELDKRLQAETKERLTSTPRTTSPPRP